MNDPIVNLFEETGQVLNAYGKNFDDVEWVGSRDGRLALFSYDDIRRVLNIEYDCGYGGQEIADDLVVVGAGWWLERHEYDGSEGWNFATKPRAARNPEPFEKVKGFSMWADLAHINDETDDD